MPGAHLQLVHAADDAEQLYAAALEHGFEGIIGKRLDSPYQPGQRSRAWLKFKTQHSEEFLVGGYTRGNGAREPLGALLLGYRDGKALRYAGHVGSGLDDAVIGTLLKRSAQLKRATSPFAEKPPLHRPTTWLKPELVAEVSYSEWTPAGALRAPVFVRLRDDVGAGQRAARRPGPGAARSRASVPRARRRRRARQAPATKLRWCSSSSRAPPSAWSSGSERRASASPTSIASTGRRAAARAAGHHQARLPALPGARQPLHAAAPRRPAPDHDPHAGRHRGRALLPEALVAGAAGLRRVGDRVLRAQGRAPPLPARQQPADAAVARPGRHTGVPRLALARPAGAGGSGREHRLLELAGRARSPRS